MKNHLNLCLLTGILVTFIGCTSSDNNQSKTAENTNWVKMKDIVIYEDAQFYSSFPSVVKNGENDYIVAFRRAPDRRIFKERDNRHVDPNSYLMMVLSTDGGMTWGEPIYPPHVDAEIKYSALGDPLPAYNRGALCEGKDGRIYWVVAASDTIPIRKTSNHLLVSDDKGVTWNYSGLVATDDSASFNEASIYETPKGDLVAFLRTANMDDQACLARSTDGGKTFNWEKMSFQDHPLNALRLPDDRVLLTYGYRHKPYGIRARILNAECTDFTTAQEIILREDGGNHDIGYTWPVLLDDNRVLVVYYFNKDNGTRYIAGTIWYSDSAPLLP